MTFSHLSLACLLLFTGLCACNDDIDHEFPRDAFERQHNTIAELTIRSWEEMTAQRLNVPLNRVHDQFRTEQIDVDTFEDAILLSISSRDRHHNLRQDTFSVPIDGTDWTSEAGQEELRLLIQAQLLTQRPGG